MRQLIAVALITLAACGDPQPPIVGDGAAPIDSSVGAAAGAISSAPVDDPVAVVAVLDDVRYYGACGNETLVLGPTTWYPVNAFDDVHAAVASVDRADPPPRPQGFAPRVAPPGPGDDVGVLVVWADGVARFRSDSGVFDVWLIDDELTYPWEC